VLGASPNTCWSGIEDHTCRLTTYVGAQAITYRVELRADQPIVVNFGAHAFEPDER
jgi:hypothetical protein